MPSVYLRLLIFLLAILIPAYASSSLTLHMKYSAYTLNKQGDNIQPWPTPFPIWNQFVVPCPILTVASWPAYRFLRRQVRWSGIPFSFRILQFVVTHTVKGFGVVNKVKVKWSHSVVSGSLQPHGSSVHGIFQARVLGWVVISFSRGSSWPRDWTWVSCIAGRHFTIWATREAPINQ